MIDGIDPVTSHSIYPTLFYANKIYNNKPVLNATIVDVVNNTQQTTASNIFATIQGKEEVSLNPFKVLLQNSPYVQYKEDDVSEPNILAGLYLQYPNDRLRKLAFSIVNPTDSNDVKMQKITSWVVKNIQYKTDDENYGAEELWAAPTMTIAKKSGDCVAVYEEIWTNTGLKKVGDLVPGDIVLSYDLEKKEFCYQPVLNIIEKGKLPVYRVSFRNGTWFDVTKDHPFWSRQYQQSSIYKRTNLCDINLTKWWKKKVPCVKKLPYNIRDIEWLNEDLCFVLGYFLAEGSNDGTHVTISGYNIPDKIIPLLEKNNIPYSIYYRKENNLPILTFLKSEFKNYLRNILKNSFEINIPHEIFNLPENKLQKILDGHFIGDGHYSLYEDKRGYINHKEIVYSTSSYQLAFDIQRIHLQLGKPLYMWLQKNHRGVGEQPIWRLSYNSNSAFSRDFGYNGVSEVSIKSIEYIGEVEVRDFEVANTHTFINKFGILCHNCEDGAFLIHSLALNAGVPASRLRTYGGLVKAGEGAATGGHGWTAYQRESDDEWVVVDWCYYPENVSTNNRTLMKDDKKYIDDYFYMTLSEYVTTEYSNRVRDPDTYDNMGNVKNEIWISSLVNIFV